MSVHNLGSDILGRSWRCDCGEVHSVPVESCYVGPDAAAELARFARACCGSSCLVVSDENTRQAGGEPVLSALSAAGKTAREKVFGSAPIEATEELARSLVPEAADMDFLVAVGSGTVCDLVKYAGDKTGRPALLFGTAASMNGYTSGIVALKVRGLKRTSPCAPALGVFCDPEVMATAPNRMNAAGVADFLSKAASSADWYVAHFLRGGYYCSRPRQILEGPTGPLLEAAPGVKEGAPEAITALANALMLSGLSLLVAGSSAPGSGGEHLISHYLDMKHALYGTPNDLHGTQVGVGTVHCLGLWERILALDLQTLDPGARAAAQPSEATIRQWIADDWGPEVSKEVLGQWREKALDRDGIRNELQKFREEFDQHRDRVRQDLLPQETVANAIQQTGGPTRPEDLEAPPDGFQKALKYGRFIRNRFTVLDLTAELGVE